MIATAAESNPSVFSPTPLVDLESTLVPSYIRLVSSRRLPFFIVTLMRLQLSVQVP